MRAEMMRNSTLLMTGVAFSLLALVGCGTAPTAKHAVLSAAAGEVVQCRYVADVTGISEEEISPRPGSNIQRAQMFALDKAQEMGATHIVWGQRARVSHGVDTIKGIAYRCSGS